MEEPVETVTLFGDHDAECILVLEVDEDVACGEYDEVEEEVWEYICDQLQTAHYEVHEDVAVVLRRYRRFAFVYEDLDEQSDHTQDTCNCEPNLQPTFESFVIFVLIHCETHINSCIFISN